MEVASPNTAASSAPRESQDDRAVRRRAGVSPRLRRRRTPHRAATHRVDRHGAVPRGGSRLLLDRPGRAGPRGSAVRPARRSRRPRLRPVVGRVPIVCASSSCPSTSGTTRSPATGCTTSPSATDGRRSPPRRFPGCRRSPPAANGRRSTTGATLRCCSIACGRAAPVSASTRRSRRMLPLADALFEPVDGEPEALADGVAAVAVRRDAAAMAERRRAHDRPRRLGRDDRSRSAGEATTQRRLRAAAGPDHRGDAPRPSREVVNAVRDPGVYQPDVSSLTADLSRRRISRRPRPRRRRR